MFDCSLLTGLFEHVRDRNYAVHGKDLTEVDYNDRAVARRPVATRAPLGEGEEEGAIGRSEAVGL